MSDRKEDVRWYRLHAPRQHVLQRDQRRSDGPGVGADALEAALAQPYARPMDFTGRPMKGFVFVDAAVLGDRDLKRWVQRGSTFAGSLPAK